MSYVEYTHALYTLLLTVLSLCALGCLVRTILGPSAADRLVAIGMLGTLGICMIALIGARSGEGGFADIALVYAPLSFFSVTVLTDILGRRQK